MENNGWIEIIDIGAEGGSICLLGKKINNHEWKFAREVYEIFFEDEFNFDSNKTNKLEKLEKNSVIGWKNALKLLNAYPWTRLCPMYVHPDFLKLVYKECKYKKVSSRWNQYFMKHGLKEVKGLDPDCEKLLNFIKQSNYTIVLTGAGSSVSSGLPDYRTSKNGLWRNKNPMTLASLNALENNRNEFIEFYTERIKTLQGVLPNVAHKILSKWEKKMLINSVITQNVDSLHVPGIKNLIELHGSLTNCHCQACKTVYANERFLNGEFYCHCGGFIRPSVVLFGEDLHSNSIYEAIKETNKADLFIVLGSSLSVAPANYFPIEAKKKGARLVIINIEPTELDSIADLAIKRPISEVLKIIDLALRK